MTELQKNFGQYFWQAGLMGCQDQAFKFRYKEIVIEKTVGLKSIEGVSWREKYEKKP